MARTRPQAAPPSALDAPLRTLLGTDPAGTVEVDVIVRGIGADATRAAQALHRVGMTPQHVLPRLGVVSAVVTVAALRSLLLDPDVSAIEENARFTF